MYETKERFAKAIPFAIGGEVNDDKTYIKTVYGGVAGPTSYFCKLTDSISVPEAASVLSGIIYANKKSKTDNRLTF